MRQHRWLRVGLATALLPPIALVVLAGSASAAPDSAKLRSAGATPTLESTELGTKTPTSRLAKTDPSLLGRSDSALIPVLVKLDHDAVATYAGGIDGLAATSPSETGQKLGRSAAETKYVDHLAAQEQAFIGELADAVPGATVRQRLRSVYGGVSATVPANKVADILKIDGVVAVQKDELRQTLTDSSPDFIGANALYPGLGGKNNAGAGVIVGIIDTGAWPEHPSFADKGNLNPAPTKRDGTPRTCDFGDNPLTPEPDAFACQNKLIGGEAFLDTYLQFNEGEDYTTARDSGGHGTHTGSTTAGNVVDSAPVFGVDRGPVQGVAPGAWVSVYKALGEGGGYSSDLAAAVQQAILDGVDVINYSISGGSQPYTDPVELAFLDAYAAGVFVSASAGNSGPTVATTNHVAPWVTTVAASTQTREFSSTLSLTAGNGETLTLRGASITGGVSTATPVVLAATYPGYEGGAICDGAAPAGLFAGKIVVCERGVTGRAQKGYDVAQGGAVGMILYNPTLADINTDNHWLPAVHLADGAEFLAWFGAHSDVTATFTAGEKRDGQGDAMAAFSSRGPGGLGIKPDITAPGVQILAGNTPTPDDVAGGPPGEMYQAIAGTSMSAPHIAGSAALLMAAHGDWSPGQVKSAMMATANTDVVKEDLTTPADPFDYGAGRVDLRKATKPGLTLDETPERMLALGNDPVASIHLNLPSINAPLLPGKIETVRTFKNVSGKSQTYTVHVKSPAKSKITVTPSSFTLGAGRSRSLTVTITSTAPTAQYFGQIVLDAAAADMPSLRLPVAFVPQQGEVALTSECAPAQIAISTNSTCTVTATNNSFADAETELTTTLNDKLRVAGVDGATQVGPRKVTKSATLTGAVPGAPTLEEPGDIYGFVSLPDAIGTAPTAVGDEALLNFNVPPFVYGGQTYTRIGIDSNGYLVVGGGTSEDNNCCELTQIPDPARPNNVLAPFWTDLDGTGAPGVYIDVITDGVDEWIVVEWQVNVWGTTSNRQFQVWLGTGDTEDIVFAYNPAALPALPPGQDLIVGAENVNGTGGEQLPAGTAPTSDLRIVSSEPVPGASVSYEVEVTGLTIGKGQVTTSMTATTVPGTTVVTSDITVRLRATGPQE